MKHMTRYVVALLLVLPCVANAADVPRFWLETVTQPSGTQPPVTTSEQWQAFQSRYPQWRAEFDDDGFAILLEGNGITTTFDQRLAPPPQPHKPVASGPVKVRVC